MNPLQRAIDKVGWSPLAKALSVSPQAVRKWLDAERLPRSEFSGETNYAGTIEAVTGGVVTADELLAWSRMGWQTSAA